MKKILLSLTLFAATSGNSFALDITKIQDLETIALDGSTINSAHYCHMDTVYISLSGLKQEAFSLVWNHETDKPLRCGEYQRYIKWLSLQNKGVKTTLAPIVHN